MSNNNKKNMYRDAAKPYFDRDLLLYCSSKITWSTFSESLAKSLTSCSTQFFGMSVPTILTPSFVFSRITCSRDWLPMRAARLFSTRAQTASTEPDSTLYVRRRKPICNGVKKTV